VGRCFGAIIRPESIATLSQRSFMHLLIDRPFQAEQEFLSLLFYDEQRLGKSWKTSIDLIESASCAEPRRWRS